MGLARHMAKEVIREIGNKSREFYEFVLPPVDMYLDKNDLVVVVDVPGYNKADIKLSIYRNILSISANKKNDTKTKDELICNQRPSHIEKRIRLPIRVKEGEEKVNSAKYENGVLTIKIPTSTKGKDISIE